MKKGLGFANLRKDNDDSHVRETLSAAAQMRPQPLEDEEMPSVENVQKAVDAQSETIRQTPLRISRKRQSKGVVQSLNMRVRLATHNRFVELSKALRMPYDETLEWLLERAGVDHEGRLPRD